MCSKGTVVGFVCLFVCLSMVKFTCSGFIRSTNDTTYLTHNKGVKFCEIFSETAPLQSQSPSSIVWLLHKSAIFLSTHKHMHILRRMRREFYTSVHSLVKHPSGIIQYTYIVHVLF